MKQSEDEDQLQARDRRSRKPKVAKKWSSTLGEWVEQTEPVSTKQSGSSRARSHSAVKGAQEDAAEGGSKRSVRGREKTGLGGAVAPVLAITSLITSSSKSADKAAMEEDGNKEDGGSASKKRRLQSASSGGGQGASAKPQAVEGPGEGGRSAPVEVKKEVAEESPSKGWWGGGLSFSKFMRS
jgi:hypothetical protein